MSKVIVILKEDEPKKHSVRFNCKDQDPAVSSIYMNKKALAELGAAVIDKGVKITIEVAE